MAHSQCVVGEYEDPLATVNQITDRVCNPFTVCNATMYEAVKGTPTSNTVCLELDTCEETQYEAVPPTPSSNRGCKSVSLPCKPGTNFQTSAPTPTSDRVCAEVNICIKNTNSSDVTTHPGFYMASPPTSIANTVCEPLQQCTYATHEIVHPVSIDTTTFSVGVYSVDRTCRARQSCWPDFETTKMTATSTACDVVQTTTYAMEFASSCDDVNSVLQSNADWEAYIADDLKAGDAATYNVAKFADTSFVASVMGTGTDYTEELVSVSLAANSCKVFVKIFFVPAGGRRRRWVQPDRSRRIATSSLPTPTTTVLPEGTTVCSSGPPEMCCEKGYGADNTGTCIACASMTYTDSETKTADKGGCTLQPKCDFKNEFFVDKTPSTQSKATNNCQTMRSCTEKGKLSEPLIEGDDRQCSAVDLVLCDFATEYWSDCANFADDGSGSGDSSIDGSSTSSGDSSSDGSATPVSEWFVNPVCATSKICDSTTWWTNSDATVDVPSKADGSNSLVVKQVFVEDRNCEARS